MKERTPPEISSLETALAEQTLQNKALTAQNQQLLNQAQEQMILIIKMQGQLEELLRAQ